MARTEKASPSGRRRTCILIVTHDCNLRCTYCYEAYKSKRSMPVALAKELVAKEFAFVASSPDFDELEIDFMGGEPLLNFALIREVVEWVRSAHFHVPFLFFATTNGTLLDAEKRAWFHANRDIVWLGLSLDGSETTQTLNRGRAATRLDLSYFRDNWPAQDVKMTVSRETLPTLAADVMYIHDQGLQPEPSLAHGIPWTDDDDRELGRQLETLVSYYLEHPEIRPSQLLTPNLAPILAANTAPRKYCGVGTHMPTYDVDGTMYPCHMFTPLVMDFGQRKALDEMRFADDAALEDRKCDTCTLRHICPTCYGMNMKVRGDIAIRDERRCQMMFTLTRAACAFQLQAVPEDASQLDEAAALRLKSLLEVWGKLEVEHRPGT